MAYQKRPRRVIKQYVIGKDLTAQDAEIMILRIAQWFASPACDRKYDDPEAMAKELFRQCLAGETKDGKPWALAPEALAARIKSKTMFDVETNTGTPMSALKSPHAHRDLDKQGTKANGKQIADMSVQLADFDVEAFRASEERKLLATYPELNNPSMETHVRRLTLLYAQQELIDRELMLSRSAGKREEALKTMETLNKTLNSLLLILDIHPESLRKKVKESEDGTLGDLVAMLDSDTQFAEREQLWSLQLLLQLWVMTKRPNGRGDGPQITEWEFWHLTRSLPIAFTCACGRHYPALVKGFTPKKAKDLLKAKGVLVTKSAMPHLIKEEHLVNIEAFIDAHEDMQMLPACPPGAPEEDLPAVNQLTAEEEATSPVEVDEWTAPEGSY